MQTAWINNISINELTTDHLHSSTYLIEQDNPILGPQVSDECKAKYSWLASSTVELSYSSSRPVVFFNQSNMYSFFAHFTLCGWDADKLPKPSFRNACLLGDLKQAKLESSKCGLFADYRHQQQNQGQGEDRGVLWARSTRVPWCRDCRRVFPFCVTIVAMVLSENSLLNSNKNDKC